MLQSSFEVRAMKVSRRSSAVARLGAAVGVRSAQGWRKGEEGTLCPARAPGRSDQIETRKVRDSDSGCYYHSG